jgi:hypothetical protein
MQISEWSFNTSVSFETRLEFLATTVTKIPLDRTTTIPVNIIIRIHKQCDSGASQSYIDHLFAEYNLFKQLVPSFISKWQHASHPQRSHRPPWASNQVYKSQHGMLPQHRRLKFPTDLPKPFKKWSRSALVRFLYTPRACSKQNDRAIPSKSTRARRNSDKSRIAFEKYEVSKKDGRPAKTKGIKAMYDQDQYWSIQWLCQERRFLKLTIGRAMLYS